MNKDIQSLMTNRAKELRRRATKAEIALFLLLKENKICFKFQSPRWHKGQFRIFDFWLPQPHRLAIEVDGGYHNAEKDAIRDALMKWARPSYTIIRVKNEEVLNHPQDTLNYIRSFMK